MRSGGRGIVLPGPTGPHGPRSECRACLSAFVMAWIMQPLRPAAAHALPAAGNSAAACLLTLCATSAAPSTSPLARLRACSGSSFSPYEPAAVSLCSQRSRGSRSTWRQRWQGSRPRPSGGSLPGGCAHHDQQPAHPQPGRPTHLGPQNVPAGEAGSSNTAMGCGLVRHPLSARRSNTTPRPVGSVHNSNTSSSSRSSSCTLTQYAAAAGLAPPLAPPPNLNPHPSPRLSA